MVAEVTKITREGQVTIPAGIRQEFGLEEGDPMVVEEQDGVMIIRRATLIEQTAGVGAPWRINPALTLEEEAVARAIGEEGARYE